MLAAQALAGFAPGGAAYNEGLLGGCDVALVRAYAWAGLDLAQKFHGCPLNGTATSMIVEQYQLGVFARRVGVEVGTLLPLAPTRTQVSKAGYAHLTGGGTLAYSTRRRRHAMTNRNDQSKAPTSDGLFGLAGSS